MLKKKFSLVTALIMMITLFVGQMPSAWAKVGFVADGYEIIDSAYGNGTYVVMAKKSSDYSAAKIYTSKDGRTWTETFTSASATNSAGKTNKQELTYWDTQNLFVTAVGSSIYTSSNGITWTKNDDLSYSNAVVESKDGILVVAGNWNVKVATSLSDIKESLEVLHKDKYYAQFIAIASDSKVFIASKDEGATIEKTTGEENNISWTRTGRINNGAVFPFISRDEKFVEGQSKWIILPSNSTKIATMTYSGYTPKVHTPLIAEGTENSAIISAIGADASSMFFGTENGKIYYIASDANLISTEETPADVWQEATAESGTTAISEKVTDIISIGTDKFFVTTATGVYSMTKTGTGYTYSDMLSYKTVEEAKITGVLPFAYNIKLLGGAYSPSLNRYVAYGNDSEGKGYIYYSNDGINWNTTNVGADGTLTHGFDEKAKNLAVWWPAQEVFVISTATQKATQTAWYSKDGIKWSFMEKNSFGDNGDIMVVGDYLYSSYKGSKKAIRKFSSLEYSANGTLPFVNVFYQRTDINNNCTTMAVSDDETPVILVGINYGQTFVNTAVAEGDTTSKAKLCTPGGTSAASQLLDVQWNTKVDKFVAVNSANNQLWLIDKDANVESLTPNKDSGILATVETNGSSYLTGGAYGTIYYSDSDEISTSSTFKEVDFNGAEKNTIPVTNSFVGENGKYFVTVSNGVKSDMLIVNADGSEYQKVSELIPAPTSIKAGDSFRVSVKTENYTETAAKLSMIVGIYTADGTKLLQAAAEDKTMAVDSEAYLTMDVTADATIPEGAKVKVFLWDSVNGMKPVAGEAKSFF